MSQCHAPQAVDFTVTRSTITCAPNASGSKLSKRRKVMATLALSAVIYIHGSPPSDVAFENNNAAPAAQEQSQKIEATSTKHPEASDETEAPATATTAEPTVEKQDEPPVDEPCSSRPVQKNIGRCFQCRAKVRLFLLKSVYVYSMMLILSPIDPARQASEQQVPMRICIL